ncbi:MAG: hypothetical protein Fur005_16970 [Roseiflexaceae bacterium]
MKTIVLVSHGTVISLYLSRVAGVDPFTYWQRLGLPSMVIYNPDTAQIEAVIDTVGR